MFSYQKETILPLWHVFLCFIWISSPPTPPVPKHHIATIQDNDNPPFSLPLPLRLGNQWAASQGETGLPRHKSHTHTIFHPVSPSFILFSTLPQFPPHCPPLPPIFCSSGLASLFQFSSRCHNSLVIARPACFSSLTFLFLCPSLALPPPSSKFTSHHPLSQTGWGWEATCRVQHGC